MRTLRAKIIHIYMPMVIVATTIIVLAFFLYTLSDCKEYFGEESSFYASKLAQEEAENRSIAFATRSSTISDVIRSQMLPHITDIDWISQQSEEQDALDHLLQMWSEKLDTKNIQLLSNDRIVYEQNLDYAKVLSDEIHQVIATNQIGYTRSEERRVGKEC